MVTKPEVGWRRQPFKILIKERLLLFGPGETTFPLEGMDGHISKSWNTTVGLMRFVELQYQSSVYKVLPALVRCSQ